MKKLLLAATCLLLIMSCRVTKDDINGLRTKNSILLTRTDSLNKKTETQRQSGKISERAKGQIEDVIKESRYRSFERRADALKADKYTKNVLTRIRYNRNLQFIENRFATHVPQLEKDGKKMDVIEETLNLGPIVDSIYFLAKKFPLEQLSAEIGIFGFTDNLGKKEDNLRMSKLRADEVGRVIQKILNVKQEEYKTINNINFYLHKEGLGEQKPNPSRDYEDEDPERRIVRVLWNISTT